MRIYRKAIIVADDLTGACDTSGQFRRFGYEVTIAIDPREVRDLVGSGDVIAISTNTRNEEASKAREIVKDVVIAILRAVRDVGFSPTDILWYKKIDSTLRGNAVDEAVAMYEALGADLMIFAPAYPKRGRITINGVHLVNGIPVAQTYFGTDSRAPARSSSIVEYFRGFSKGYKHIYIDELRSGISSYNICDYDILSSDIEVDEDFRLLVDRVLTCSEHGIYLWVGSAGLAEHLAGRMIIATPREKITLVCIGSPNDVTKRQLARLMDEVATCTILLNIERLLLDSQNYMRDLLTELAICLNEKRQVIIIASAYKEWQLEQARQVASISGMSMASIGEYISEGLGRVCAEATNAIGLSRVEGIVLSGGDTALSVLRLLGLHKLRVVGEVEPGIPIMEADGGIRVVTKAGGFGDLYSLTRILYRLGGWQIYG